MENIKIPLNCQFNLELDCFFEYEPEVPSDKINPPEPATVELLHVYLGDSVLKYNLHLTHEQWTDIEQHILELKAWE